MPGLSSNRLLCIFSYDHHDLPLMQSNHTKHKEKLCKDLCCQGSITVHIWLGISP